MTFSIKSIVIKSTKISAIVNTFSNLFGNNYNKLNISKKYHLARTSSGVLKVSTNSFI